MSYGFIETLQITGLNELRTRLSAFGDKFVNTVTQKALLDGARIIQGEAKVLVPVWTKGRHWLVSKNSKNGRWIEEGNLKKNIRIRRLKKVEWGTKGAQVYVKLKDAWYAQWVEGMENGTSRQAAVPFMRKSFESKQAEVIVVFEKAIQEAIKSGGL